MNIPVLLLHRLNDDQQSMMQCSVNNWAIVSNFWCYQYVLSICVEYHNICVLTHQGRVTTTVSLTNIGSDNGLSSVRHLTKILIDAGS